MKEFFKKVLNWIIFGLLFIWQLPQNIIGLIMFAYFKLRKNLTEIKYEDYTYSYTSKYMSGGISLGNFIFLSENLGKQVTSVMHEYGHCWDSKRMGPFYLFIVGLPSILNAIFSFTDCYYDFFTEKWANKHANLGVDKRCRLYIKDR